jgi:hypothetical protein
LLCVDLFVCEKLVNNVSVMLFHDNHGFNLLSVSVTKLI